MALQHSTKMGFVQLQFRIAATISESKNSTFSIVISGSDTPRSIRSEPGPKMYAIITTRNANGMIPLAASFAFDVFFTSIFFTLLWPQSLLPKRFRPIPFLKTLPYVHETDTYLDMCIQTP